MKKLFSMLAVAVLTACGGGGGSSDTTPPPAAAKPDRLLAIGNSITRHPPAPSIQWSGDWGMAASSQDKDWAHMTGAALGLQVTAINRVDLENDPSAQVGTLPITPTTVVAVMLGDNALPLHYDELLAATKGSARLLCISTYWERPADVTMKSACQRAGGTWVDISGIYVNRQDDTSVWTNPAIQLHPYDWSMARIAERVVTAYRQQ